MCVIDFYLTRKWDQS